MEGNVTLEVDEYNRLTKIERDMVRVLDGNSHPVKVVNHFFYSRSYNLNVESNQTRIMTKGELKASIEYADTCLGRTIEMSLSEIMALKERNKELNEKAERLLYGLDGKCKQVRRFKDSSLFKRLVTALFNRI